MEAICMSRMILAVNTDNFPKLSWLTGVLLEKACIVFQGGNGYLYLYKIDETWLCQGSGG